MSNNSESAIYTYRQLAADVLQDSPIPLTADEIWSVAVNRGLHTKLRKVGKTPTATLYSDLHRATLEDGDSDFERVGSRPRKYWLKNRAIPGGSQIILAPPVEAVETPPTPSPPTVGTLTERDLHPLLAYFADRNLNGVLVRTIFHERSRKKAFGEWVHPDLVGVLFPKRALDNNQAIRLSAALSAPICKLYSFELKLKLDFTNLREAFFQAVSNSSWSHEGYLVAASIDPSPEFMEELERLCGGFGIGVIELLPDDPDSSAIRVQARTKPDLDWATVDKLSEMNSDFASFLKNVTDDLATDIHDKEYDAIPEDPLRYVEERRTAKATGGAIAQPQPGERR